jgi:hypothetical protein
MHAHFRAFARSASPPPVRPPRPTVRGTGSHAGRKTFFLAPPSGLISLCLFLGSSSSLFVFFVLAGASYVCPTFLRMPGHVCNCKGMCTAPTGGAACVHRATACTRTSRCPIRARWRGVGARTGTEGDRWCQVPAVCVARVISGGLFWERLFLAFLGLFLGLGSLCLCR